MRSAERYENVVTDETIIVPQGSEDRNGELLET
jgi:hypothetical protein